uniref:Fibronectin type-III domain-containing protein n=1 Tax=Pundamilia nyererei TaxID=303518 RepID=A0A3B4F6P1_9CICH
RHSPKTLRRLSLTLSGSGGLSAPTHVRLTSYNMDLVLRWDPPEGTTDVLTYTAEYSHFQFECLPSGGRNR